MLNEKHYLCTGPTKANKIIILAHGAGAPMDSPFMTAFSKGLGARGIQVVRFEFPYMQRRRAEGSARPPDRSPKLEETWREVVANVRTTFTDSKTLVIGGKSMGGRIASLIADSEGVDGLVCLGYPFHPPGKPQKTRTEHLFSLRTPTLIVQGMRDSLGDFDDVQGYQLSNNTELFWLEDGDHSFKPRKASGRTEEQAWKEGIDAVGNFIEAL